MQVGTVVGTATSTIKHASMEGWKLLVVQPMRVDGATPDGDPVLAIARGADRDDLDDDAHGAQLAGDKVSLPAG